MVGILEYFDLNKRVYIPPVCEPRAGGTIAAPVIQTGAKKAGMAVSSVSTSEVHITEKSKGLIAPSLKSDKGNPADVNRAAPPAAPRKGKQPLFSRGQPRHVNAADEEVPRPKKQQKPADEVPIWEQTLMYAGLVLGVLFSSAVMAGASGNIIIIDTSWYSIAVSLMVALIISPSAFEKLKTQQGYLYGQGRTVRSTGSVLASDH